MGACDNNAVVGNAYIVSRMDATDILNLAEEFVVQYYTVMRKCPSGLHRFYKDDSSMIHENSTVFGQKPIHDKIMSMNIHDSRVGILRLDALRANGNSVLIQVAGEISLNHSEPRRFMQSFVLCEQSPCDFYVLNDIFRYQDHVFGDVKLDRRVDSPPMSPVNFQSEEVIRNSSIGDEQDNVAPWNNTTHVQPDMYSKPSADSLEPHGINHIELSHQNEPEQNVERLPSGSLGTDSRTPSSPHPQASTSLDEPIEIPAATQPCSWAQMASKQPAHGVLNMQPIKPTRGPPSALINQTTEEQAKGARSGTIPPGANSMQRPRGAIGRPQPVVDVRSASGDNAFVPKSRPSGQGIMRGGSGRGAPGFGMRGTGRGGRGGGPSLMGGRGSGSSFQRRGQ